MALVIRTGLLLDRIRKDLKALVYMPLNFSFTVILSWLTRLFSLVLSSMRLRLPSCWMAISGLFLKLSRLNALFALPRALLSTLSVYPGKSPLSMMSSSVLFPLPGSPYSTMNFCMVLLAPVTMLPMHHSILCFSSSAYSVPISLSQASVFPASSG